MAGKYTDEQIASTLNRLGLRTGTDNTWNESRVYSARHYHELPAFDPHSNSDQYLTLEQAAERLEVSPASVRRMIEQKKLSASQVVVGAPWQIPVAALDSGLIRQIVNHIKHGVRVPQTQITAEQHVMFSKS